MRKDQALQHLIDFALSSNLVDFEDENILIAIDVLKNTAGDDHLEISDEEAIANNSDEMLVVDKVLNGFKALQRSHSGLELGVSFSTVRNYALKCLKNNNFSDLEAKVGGVLPNEVTERYEAASLFHKFKTHYFHTTADHYASYVLDVFSALSRRERTDDLTFLVPATSIRTDFSEVPFLCFLNPFERRGG